MRLAYPANLEFSSLNLRAFAGKLLPFTRAFFESGILDPDNQTWNNIFLHCLQEALIVDTLVEHIPSLGNRETLRTAAFLHDAYKRQEIEKIQTSSDPSLLYQTDSESKAWLRNLRYGPEIIDLQEAFGNNAARKIFSSEITDLPRRMLHYVDDITQGDQIVSLEERLSALEEKPQYAEQNEWSRRFFDGQTLYQAKRVFNGKTEKELATLLGVIPSTDLPEWIRHHTTDTVYCH